MQRNILNSLYHLRAIQKTHVICCNASHSYSIFHHVPKCNSNRAINENCRVLYSIYNISSRNIFISSNRPSKEKTKIEETITVLKEEQAKKKSDDPSKAELNINNGDRVVFTPAEKKEATSSVIQPKRSIGKKIVDEIIHYYNGFRLLFVDIRVCCRLIWKLLKGSSLSRRENRQLVRTVSDIFRLVPFSIFIIIPFLELLLPLFLKFFPQMLPSTFQTATEKEKKFVTQLKLKIEMAKFLQDTLDELALHAKGETHSESAKEFAIFFEKNVKNFLRKISDLNKYTLIANSGIPEYLRKQKFGKTQSLIRSSGAGPTNEEILKFSKLFEDELTLDNLPRPSLIALCRLLELQPIGTNNLLRFQLRMRLRTLKADDQLIQKEGIESLSVSELQAACRARGMRALGLPEERLRSQLKSWLELSLAEQIPASLLLLSRALYLPENLDAPDQLKATLSTLPDTAATEAKYKIGEIEGKVDNKTKLELIKKEEAVIKKEAEEIVQEKLDKQKEAEKEKESEAEKIGVPAADLLTDKAPVLLDKAPIMKTDEAADKKELSKEDFDDLEDALENIANEKKSLLIEKEEIEDLKEDMADYKQDIEELKDMVLETGHKELSESKAALRLSNKVNKMISKMDMLLDELTKERVNLQQQIDDKAKEGVSASKERDDIISINELVLAIRRIQKVSDDTRLQRIADVLEKMDVDHDGAVEIDHVLKVIELLGKDNVKVTAKQMDEIIELLMKEGSLELEEKILKRKQLDENLSQEKN